MMKSYSILYILLCIRSRTSCAQGSYNETIRGFLELTIQFTESLRESKIIILEDYTASGVCITNLMSFETLQLFSSYRTCPDARLKSNTTKSICTKI